MRLRFKLLLIYGLVVFAGAACALIVLEIIATTELRKTAENHLREVAITLAKQGDKQIEVQFKKLDAWSHMALVIQTALNPDNTRLVGEFVDYFEKFSYDDHTYGTLLLNLDGECIAAHDRWWMYNPYSRDKVSTRDAARAAYAGECTLGETSLSVVLLRPAVELYAPVLHEEKVIAILRTKLDMGLLNNHLNEFLALDSTKGNRVYVDAPGLDRSILSQSDPIESAKHPRWIPPPDFVEPALKTAPDGICYLDGDEGPLMAASTRMTAPPWRITLTQPMSAVLAPAKRLRRLTAAILLFLVAFLLLTLIVFIAPSVRGIERCRILAESLREGNLEERLSISGRDEVASLAISLNSLAEDLQKSRKDLAKAETKYKTIFDTAVEGIFQTTADGTLVTVNNALADLGEFNSLEECLGTNVIDRYADPTRRADLLNALKNFGRVANFEYDMLSIKGNIRQCELTAQAEFDSDGKIKLIQGVILDVTERKQIEETRKKALETEKLLAESRWNTLRKQVNPHFLCNALNSVEALMGKNPEDARKMIDRLAQFCRATLMESADGMNSIAEEVEIADQYLWIEKIRYGESLQIAVDVDKALNEFRIPLFTLQTLVENAVKYGQLSRAYPLKIKINIEKNDNGVLIEVSNSGKWFKREENASTSPGIGLTNLQNRYRFIFDDSARIDTTEKDGFVVISITIS